MTIIHDLIREGRKLKILKRSAEEAKKPAALRVGNTGCLVDKGDEDIVFGECPRKAHIRHLGIELHADATTHEIFDEGITNEDIVKDLFADGLEAMGNPYVMKQEEEIPVSWPTSTGALVTGRPDFVFLKDDKPQFMVELKKKVGFYGVRNSTYECKPDTKHLCQAAHYSWQLGMIPCYLVYRSGTLYHLDSEVRKSTIENTGITRALEYKGGQRRPTAILPHYTIYELTWDGEGEDAKLCYTSEDMNRTETTVITPAGIRGFYEATAVLAQHKHLGPRPSTKSPIGGKATYSQCSYCELKPVCDSYESDYDTWLDHVKIKASELAAWLTSSNNQTKGKENGNGKGKVSKQKRK